MLCNKFVKMFNLTHLRNVIVTRAAICVRMCHNQLLRDRNNNTEIVESFKMNHNNENIPPLLLRPGQSIWRFKNFFNLLKPQRKPKAEFASSNGVWVCRLYVMQPMEVTFDGRSTKKKDAESIAMAKALLWLRDNNYVNDDFTPIHSTPVQRKRFVEKRNAPICIAQIHKDTADKINEFIMFYESEIKGLVKDRITDKFIRGFSTLPNHNNDNNNNNDDLEIESPHYSDDETQVKEIRNLITNGPLKKLSLNEMFERNHTLKEHIRKRSERMVNDQIYSQMRHKMSELPISKFKETILETIQNNRVTVISGDTGCGKTTQVPQYIFEDHINKELGSFCNIIITQPRRISAISMAERVAIEFGDESLGESIGFNVRFNRTLPIHGDGAMLFCSAGVLLRKFQHSPELKGISHVIIDEVHERDVITDFLLVLLKRLIKVNPNINVILMSASMNAQLFSDFFDKCPVIEIPGRCFPVRNFYLPEILQKIGNSFKVPKVMLNNPKIDKEIIFGLINYISKNKPDGAILCFVPGWKEIEEITEYLKVCSNEPLLVLPVHSKLPHDVQRKIFSKPPAGVRKVVISTNIAETSITIDDVVYVIDSGLCREMNYNKHLNVSAFGTHWISKANARQRAGRAGRVRPGECYKIYSHETESDFMDDFATPELLRIPLESVVMEAKFHCPNEYAEQFLSEVPQPPSSFAIRSAIEVLKSIKVLTDNESLTPLGKRIVGFTTHPRLSVSLVYASMLGCLYPMLNISAILSATREPFQVMPNERNKIRAVKKNYAFSMLSDHISLAHIIMEYENAIPGRESEQFCRENLLNHFAMNTVMEIRNLFANHMVSADFAKPLLWSDKMSKVNINWHNKELILSSIILGYNSNILRLMSGELRNDKIIKRITPFDINSGKKVKFLSESLLNDRFDSEEHPEYVNGLIVYFNSFYSQDAHMITVRDASFISPLMFLIFGGKKFEIIPQHESENAIVKIDNNRFLEFSIKTNDAHSLSQWSDILNDFTQWYAIAKGKQSFDEENRKIFDSLSKFIEITRELLQY